MSGVTSASIVGVNGCSSRLEGLDCSRERELHRVQERDCGLAHDDDQLRLHDVQLAEEKGPRLLLVAVGELQAVRAVDRHRVDAQPLQRLEQRVPGTAVERDALLELRRAGLVLQKEDVCERMPGADNGHARAVACLRDLVTESIDLGDGLLQVLLVDLVGRHGHLSPWDGSPLADPFLGLSHPLESLEVRKRLRATQDFRVA